MNAKNYSVMAAITMGCFGCGAVLPKMDASRSVQNGGAFVGFTQDGKPIDQGDMADKLALEPEAAPSVERARVLKVVSTILAAAGGALVGWPLGEFAGGERRPNWKLAAIGGGAIAVGIPLAIWSDSNMGDAVATHNKRVEKGDASTRFMTTTSKPTWKPGERAGAPSVPSGAF